MRETQLPLWTGKELKDRGIEKTLEAEGDDWKSVVRRGLLVYAANHGEFTIDDFRTFFAWEPHHPNCWGALTTQAIRGGMIRPTGRYQKAIAASRHAAKVPVYTRGWQ